MLIALLTIAAFFLIRYALIRYGRKMTESTAIAAGVAVIGALIFYLAGGLFGGGQATGPVPALVAPDSTLAGEPVHPANITIGSLGALKLVQGKGGLGYIDVINRINPDSQALELRFPLGSILLLDGWAGEPSGAPGAALIVIVDSKTRHDLTKWYGIARPDVAKHFGSRTMEFSGFARAAMPTAGLSKGAHRLELGVVLADGQQYYLVKQIRTIHLY
jgi:hypothetical protein